MLETANKNRLTRTNGCVFGSGIISEDDGLKYFVDIESRTHNVIDDEKGRYLYAVLEVSGVRWTVS